MTCTVPRRISRWRRSNAAPATIDSDYRGELMIPMINLGTEPVAVTRGMRIAQLVFQRIEQIELVEVQGLPVSERGGGGFGSTGE